MIKYDVQYRSVDGSKWISAMTPYREEDNAQAEVDIKTFRDAYPEREFRMIKRTDEVVR